MATVNLHNTGEQVDSSLDGIVIMDHISGIPGGRSLDTTGFTPKVIKAGHIIIKDTSSGDYKPMPISESAYAALPADHEYAGVLVASILTAKPFAGIMTRGTVNISVSPYTISGILAAVKAALPHIDFRAE